MSNVCAECGVDRDELMELRRYTSVWSFLIGCVTVVVLGIATFIAYAPRSPSDEEKCSMMCKGNVAKHIAEHYERIEPTGLNDTPAVFMPETCECLKPSAKE